MQPWIVHILVFDTLWSVFGVVTAHLSFRDRVSAYPPFLVPYDSAWVYVALVSWLTGSLHLVVFNYVVWAVCVLFNMAAVYKFARAEYVPGGSKRAFWIKAAIEFPFAIALWAYLVPPSWRLSQLTFEALFRTAVTFTFVIALSFLIMGLYRKDVAGQSVYGILIRAMGGAGWQITFPLVAPPPYRDDLHIRVMGWLVLAADVAYLIVLTTKARRLGVPIWRRL